MTTRGGITRSGDVLAWVETAMTRSAASTAVFSIQLDRR
jgi:hypothetical protein